MSTNDQDLTFDLTPNRSSIIKVVGVGGGGNNAVNYMYKQGINEVNFVVCNTDSQALESSPIPVKVQLGKELTEGLGAGSNPEKGKQSAIDSLDEIDSLLSGNTKMVFITAGMGGGTGTGAAPVIAQRAKELGILTVAIVTLPFKFESRLRFNQALEGVNSLKDKVDSLLLINNEKLREIYGNLPISQAFAKADNVLLVAARGIAEIITGRGYVNVDFADVSTIMRNSGLAIMGSAVKEGPNRAIEAIQEALNSPLLNNNDITGARSVLLNVTYGTRELALDELSDITDYVYNSISQDAHFIWGMGVDPSLGDGINVTIIATRFEDNTIPDPIHPEQHKEILVLDEKSGNDVSSVIQSRDMSVRSLSSSVEKLMKEGRAEKMVGAEVTAVPATERSARQEPRMPQAVPVNRPVSLFEDPSVVDTLESQPAFLRKKIALDLNSGKESPKTGSTRSDYSVGKEGLSSGNPFLNPGKD
ncbi:MAG: cell division protein FtsZ [Bacteroidales bacterium]